jgi:hypothetical protein
VKTFQELKLEEEKVLAEKAAKKAAERIESEKRRQEWLSHGIYEAADRALKKVNGELTKKIAENKGILPKSFSCQIAWCHSPDVAEIVVDKLKQLGYDASYRLGSGTWSPSDDYRDIPYTDTDIIIKFK